MNMDHVRITDVKNTTIEDISAKKHNIWIGISLGNKYFNKDHLRNYLNWAVKTCKERTLVIIADEPHEINYKVFEQLENEKASAKAFRKSNEILRVLNEIVADFVPENRSKIEIIKWNSLSSLPEYKIKFGYIEDLYQTNENFHNQILNIVKLNLGERIENFAEEQIEALAKYVLWEFPIFLGALIYNSTIYDLHIYPGLSLMDDLILDIQDKKIFPELTEKVIIEHKLTIAEVYAD